MAIDADCHAMDPSSPQPRLSPFCKLIAGRGINGDFLFMAA